MSDDPFQSNPKSRTGGVTTPKSTRILAENWRSGSSTSSDRPESESPLTAKSNRKNSPGNGGPPGPGYTVVTAEHAQAIYPPSCCVFVAKYVLPVIYRLRLANPFQSTTNRERGVTSNGCYSNLPRIRTGVRQDPSRCEAYALCILSIHCKSRSSHFRRITILINSLRKPSTRIVRFKKAKDA